MSAHLGGHAPFQHLHTDEGNMPRHRIDARKGQGIFPDAAKMLIASRRWQKKTRPTRWRWAGECLY